MKPKLKYFKPEEFLCRCGQSICEGDALHKLEKVMSPDLMKALDKLRDRCGFPLKITSGYRCRYHPIESKKENPGAHAQGKAVDVACHDAHHRFIIMQQAMIMDVFEGMGIHKNFIHLDIGHDYAARPAAFPY